MTPKDVIDLAKEKEAKVVDIRFTDLVGQQQHFSIPADALDEDKFEEGLAFDGSSIRGFKAINESDMLLIPDPDTAYIDPFTDVTTLNITCDIEDPITREVYNRDPAPGRQEGREATSQSTGIADTAYFGPEAEFYIFNDVRYDQTSHSGYYYLDSDEGIWNSGRDEKPNLGYKIPYKRGYFPVPPNDSLQDLRTEMMLNLIEAGIEVEMQHHEVGTAGQSEIDMKFDTLLTHGRQAAEVQVHHQEHGVPERLHGDLHAQAAVPGQRLRHARPPVALEGRPAAVLRREGLRPAVRDGGPLHRRHPEARARAARLLRARPPTPTAAWFPATRRRSTWSTRARNRSACVRIPMVSKSPKAKRIEFRAPDPSANPYLALRRAADGRSRRHREQDHAARARSTKTSTRWSRRRRRTSQQTPGTPGRVARRARSRPRVPAQRRRLHART